MSSEAIVQPSADFLSAVSFQSVQAEMPVKYVVQSVAFELERRLADAFFQDVQVSLHAVSAES